MTIKRPDETRGRKKKTTAVPSAPKPKKEKKKKGELPIFEIKKGHFLVSFND